MKRLKPLQSFSQEVKWAIISLKCCWKICVCWNWWLFSLTWLFFSEKRPHFSGFMKSPEMLACAGMLMNQFLSNFEYTHWRHCNYLDLCSRCRKYPKCLERFRKWLKRSLVSIASMDHSSTGTSCCWCIWILRITKQKRTLSTDIIVYTHC